MKLNVKKIQKSSILSGIAIIGVIATAVLSSKAGIKAKKVIDEEKPATKRETIKLVWKNYIPTAAVATVTIGCIVMARRIDAKQIAVLTGSVAYLTKKRDVLEQKLRDILPEDEFRKIKKEVNDEVSKSLSSKVNFVDIQETGYGNTLCKLATDYFDIWFRSDPVEVKRAIDELYERRKRKEYIGFIEFLDSLHIYLKPPMEMLFYEWGWPASSPGCYCGFDENSPIYIDLNMTEGYVPGFTEETLVIDLLTPPIECYIEY